MIADLKRLMALIRLVYSKGDQQVKDIIKLELKRIYPKLDITRFLDNCK